MNDKAVTLETILQSDFEAILSGWLEDQGEEGAKRTDIVSAEETEAQSRELLSALSRATHEAKTDDEFDFSNPAWDQVREALEMISENRTERGVSPTEMAWLITTMKQSLFERLRKSLGRRPAELIDQIWNTTRVVDQLALYALSEYVKRREEIIERQQSEMTEVSAPVVKIWDRIVTVPLLGTVDSWRAQTVMENLLDAIVEREAAVVIIDVTGVSTVDTMVAQHLLKTAAAVRLMGAECVISGISPKIAQTIVHLGVELPNIVTRSDLQSGLAYAFERIGVSVEQA